MSLPLSVYKRLPKRLPYSLGFKRYTLHFDGVDDYVEVPHSVSLEVGNVFTVEGLLMVPSGYYGNLYDKRVLRGSKGKVLWVRKVDGKVGFQLHDGTSGVELTSTSVVWDKLTYVAVTADGSTMKLYVNSVLEDSGDISGIGDTESYEPIWLGRDRYNTSVYGKQLISFLRIYDRALTEGEIRYNMLNYHNPIRDGLVLWFHDRIVADTWYDESGMGNHGTIYGAVRRNVSMWELRAEVGL